MWYSAGTVTVTNGQRLVTGAGTDFVSNIFAGQGFVGPDNRTYEIEQVVSATQLMLRTPFFGNTAGGIGYSIIPTQSFMKDLADRAAELIGSFGNVRDTIGAGLMQGGSAAAPGMRFQADQDTGFRRYGDNGFSIVTGGVDRLYINDVGVGVGVSPDGRAALMVQGNDQTTPSLADGGDHGASLFLRAIGTGAGAGGALLLGTSFGNLNPFAAIKSAVVDGSNNTSGDLHISLRGSPTDAALTPRMTIRADGRVGVGTTQPVSRMHVAGGGHSSIDIVDGAAQGATIYAQDARTDAGAGGQVVFGAGGGSGKVFAGIRGYLVNGDDNSSGHLYFCSRAAPTHTKLTARWRLTPDGHWQPADDNVEDIAQSNLRVRNIYLAAAPIVTSDVRTKQQIGDVPDEWLDAWGDLRHVRFKFNTAVAEKGDAARWHVGYIAQEIRDAYLDRGLNATDIGLLGHDEWEEETALEYVDEQRIKRTPRAVPSAGGLLDAKGNPIVNWTYDEAPEIVRVPTGRTIVTREAGDRWSIRPDECAAMEAAWTRREIARQAARLTALELA